MSTGLVIQDKEKNEYVWVEVPKISDIYITAGLNITEEEFDEVQDEFVDETTNNIYNKIEKDLQLYANYYRNDTNFKDTWRKEYFNSSNWYTKKQYYDIKKKMLKSIYQNGGFWVGRYEAGIPDGKGCRTNWSEISDEDRAEIKANLYPYNYTKRTDAKVLAERVNKGSCTSSLMFGIQWDLVLKYIEEKTVENELENKEKAREEIREKLNVKSIDIGNYYNSEFMLDRGKFARANDWGDWYEFDSKKRDSLVSNKKKLAQVSNNNAILLTTGASDATCLQNIYDLIGNVTEWTIESNEDNSATTRGSSVWANGNVSPGSERNAKSSGLYTYTTRI